MSCGKCKYNLHMACFNLPPRLPSLPLLHNEAEHELVLISCPKHKPWKCLKFDEDFRCSVCRLYTNGLMYRCSKCRFKADVKCASLPQTIHHAAHRQQLLNLLTPQDIESNDLSWRMCDAGCILYSPSLDDSFCYADSSYEFAVCVRCALLPATVRSRRWDRHHPRLPLTYDANLNHPGEFYCDHCETKMNPKSWMYHCRPCDPSPSTPNALSLHPASTKTSSSSRNIRLTKLFTRTLSPTNFSPPNAAATPVIGIIAMNVKDFSAHPAISSFVSISAVKKWSDMGAFSPSISDHNIMFTTS